MLISLAMTPNEKLDLLVNTLFEQYQINFSKDQYAIYKDNHNIKWKGNVEGWGVYSYNEFSIYFPEIVGYYDDIFIDRISKSVYPVKIVFKNSIPTLDDLQFLQKCFGKCEGIKQTNIDDDFYNNDIYTYTTDKYLIKFILHYGMVENIAVEQKK